MRRRSSPALFSFYRPRKSIARPQDRTENTWADFARRL